MNRKGVLLLRYTGPCILPKTTISTCHSLTKDVPGSCLPQMLLPMASLVAEANKITLIKNMDEFDPFYAPRNLLELFLIALPFLWLCLDFS